MFLYTNKKTYEGEINSSFIIALKIQLMGHRELKIYIYYIYKLYL